MPQSTPQAQLSELWSHPTQEADTVHRQAQAASNRPTLRQIDGPNESTQLFEDDEAGAEARDSLASRLARIRQARQAQAEAEETQGVLNGKAGIKPLRVWAPVPEQDLPTPRTLLADPLPWTADAPALELAQGGGFFGLDRLHPAEQVHVLSLGGSGSGKTASNVAPLMRAMLRYALPTASGPKSTSLLIVDPKRELLDVVHAELHRAGQLDRLHVLGDIDTPPVRFFDLDCGLSTRDRLARLNVLLGTATQAEGNHAYWQNAALEVVLKFMSLERDYRAVTDLPLVSYLPVAMKRRTNSVPHFWSALNEAYRISMGSQREFRMLASALEQCLREPGLLKHPDATVLEAFRSSDDQYMQWAYRTQCAEPMLALLGDTTITNLVDFDPFPEPGQHRLDLRQLMDSGAVVVLQPEPRQASDLAARAIKAKWYETATSRNDMERPVGVVCDEFQRFITLDPVSGDANFLDTARAYRVNCVFATQSVAALELALGSNPRARAAVAAILCNTPSKWFFASKDRATVQELRDLIPPSPGGRHVVDVRPPAQLQPGEAYWSLANGQWGRGRADLAQLR